MNSLPQDFIDNMHTLLGDSESEALCRALNESSPCVSIRHNRGKGSVFFEQEESVPWCSTGYYLAERPAFTFDPRLHAGGYYVQEASSMFIEQAYRCIATQIQAQRVLDLCAAPGGKSTLWRSLLPDGALLVANEPIRTRANILAENLAKWGHPDVVVTQGYAEHFASLSDFFDIVAADVPCSGEGMMRKDEGARSEWSRANVLNCAQRQRDIIAAIWPTLHTGGYLVYSTCTFNREENEDNVHYICQELGAECVPIPIKEEWGIVGDCTGRDLPVYHFMPHRTRGEGIFLALMRKTAPSSPPSKSKKQKERGKQTPFPRDIEQWLTEPEFFSLLRTSPEQIVAVRRSLLPDVQRIMAAVPCVSVGVALAEEKGRKLIPQQALALSTQLSPKAFVRVDVERSTALSYLRREAIVLPAETPRGYVLLTYEGLPLGFVNNLGTRANNLYPQEWRIRSQSE